MFMQMVAEPWHNQTESKELGIKDSKSDLQLLGLWEELVIIWSGKKKSYLNLLKMLSVLNFNACVHYKLIEVLTCSP